MKGIQKKIGVVFVIVVLVTSQLASIVSAHADSAEPMVVIDTITCGEEFVTGKSEPNKTVVAYKLKPVSNGATSAFSGKLQPWGEKGWQELGRGTSDNIGKYSIPISPVKDGSFVKVAQLEGATEKYSSEQMVSMSMIVSKFGRTAYANGVKKNTIVDNLVSQYDYDPNFSTNKAASIEIDIAEKMYFNCIRIRTGDIYVSNIASYTVSIKKDDGSFEEVQSKVVVDQRLPDIILEGRIYSQRKTPELYINLGDQVTSRVKIDFVPVAGTTVTILEILLLDTNNVYRGEAKDDEEILDWIKRAAYNYYVDSLNNNPESMAYGLPGNNPFDWGRNISAVTQLGHCLNTFIIGAEEEFDPYDIIEQRVLNIVKTIWNHVPHEFGVFYPSFSHNPDWRNPNRLEPYMFISASSSDSGQMMGGVLAAGEYFGGEIKEYTDKIYDRYDLSKFVIPDFVMTARDGTRKIYYSFTGITAGGSYPTPTHHRDPNMFVGFEKEFEKYYDRSVYPADFGFDGWKWGKMSEAFNIYFYNAGHPTKSSPYIWDMYYADQKTFDFDRNEGYFTNAFLDEDGNPSLDPKYWYGSRATGGTKVFNTSQGLNNLWVQNLDFRDKVDLDNTNIAKIKHDVMMVNSNWAAAKKLHGSDTATEIKYMRWRSLAADSWGAMGTYGPYGYIEWAGQPPSTLYDEDGILAPASSISAIALAPEYVLPNIRNYYYNHPSLWNHRYGFYGSFSVDHLFPEIALPFYSEGYAELPRAIIPASIENYQTGGIWRLTMSNENVMNGFEKFGFKSEKVVQNANYVVTPGDGKVTIEISSPEDMTKMGRSDYQVVYIYDKDGKRLITPTPFKNINEHNRILAPIYCEDGKEIYVFDNLVNDQEYTYKIVRMRNGMRSAQAEIKVTPSKKTQIAIPSTNKPPESKNNPGSKTFDKATAPDVAPALGMVTIEMAAPFLAGAGGVFIIVLLIILLVKKKRGKWYY